MPLQLIDKPVRSTSDAACIHTSRSQLYGFDALPGYQEVAPKKALDAGAGKLRNFWMFPKGSYTGVGKQRGDLKDGRAMCSDQIKVLGNPDLHVFDLNNDFHFFGPFDMVVCTGTADYFDDPADVLRRMAFIAHQGRDFGV